MRQLSRNVPRALAAAAVLFLSIATAEAQNAGQAATNRIVASADTFLGTLTDAQRKTILFAFDDQKQRARWSNFPTGFIPRAGISLRQMTPKQRTAALDLLQTVLSPMGYEKVQQIMEGDEVNKVQDAKNGGRPPGGGRQGGPPNGGNGGPPPGGFPGGGPGGGGPPKLSGDMFGRDLYYFSILGTPSEKAPWMLQFGGHHLALNITIAGDQGALTPTLTGAQPALYTSNGKVVRPLGRESDKALALLNTLDESERKQAILSYKLADLVLGPGQDGVILQPEGLKASAMNEHQRAMLLDLISEWAGIIQPAAAAVRMAQMKTDLNDTWFSWSGPTDGTPGKNITAYYRVQGPHLVIEYAPQTLENDPAMHVHSMYRDPTNDYGSALVKK